MHHRILRAFASALVIVMAATCGGGSEAPAEMAEPAAPAAPAFDPATAGNVMGTITLEGTAPAAESIRMNADPVCVTEASMTETEYFLVGDTGGLGNVFVYVKEGLEGQTFPAATDSIELQQDGCRYIPHVFGIRVGQALSIVNGDPTLHNIHATPANNEEFNTGQPIEGMVYERMFDTPEVMVPFQCDVHGWMNAYVGVLDHPYFGVSGADGAFDLSGLPPGDYVVEAWHEKLGTQTQNVTVGEGATAELNFTFTVG
jgi:plastocyanin